MLLQAVAVFGEGLLPQGVWPWSHSTNKPRCRPCWAGLSAGCRPAGPRQHCCRLTMVVVVVGAVVGGVSGEQHAPVRGACTWGSEAWDSEHGQGLPLRHCASAIAEPSFWTGTQLCSCNLQGAVQPMPCMHGSMQWSVDAGIPRRGLQLGSRLGCSPATMTAALHTGERRNEVRHSPAGPSRLQAGG